MKKVIIIKNLNFKKKMKKIKILNNRKKIIKIYKKMNNKLNKIIIIIINNNNKKKHNWLDKLDMKSKCKRKKNKNYQNKDRFIRY